MHGGAIGVQVAFDSSLRTPGTWHYYIQHRTAAINSSGSDFSNVRIRIQNGEGEIADFRS